MAEIELYNVDGSEEGKIQLPSIFSSEYRKDLVQRAILSEQSLSYQPQGHFVLAGMQTTAAYIGRMATYRTGRHMGIAIRPRQKLGGGAMGEVRRIPSSRKGKRAHPHMVEKKIVERINAKEYRKAMQSAIGGTSVASLVKARSTLPEAKKLPIVIDDKIESIKKTKDLVKFIEKMNLKADLEKSEKPRLRSNSRRSRKRIFRKSILFVVKDDSALGKAGRNIPGVDVCQVDKLKVSLLAPGAIPRITVWSKGAIEAVEGAVEKAKL
ncbi:MAG: 50S ribosomal protein L4 [Candidatus Micrarchaeia archaeon]